MFLKTQRGASSVKLRLVDILYLLSDPGLICLLFIAFPRPLTPSPCERTASTLSTQQKRLSPKSLRTTQEIAKSDNLFLSPQPPCRLGLCGHAPLPRTGLPVCPRHCITRVFTYLSQLFSSFHHLLDGRLLASPFFLLVRQLDLYILPNLLVP